MRGHVSFPPLKGIDSIKLLGGVYLQTQSLRLTDIAYHHLAIAVVFILAGHMFRINCGVGHSMQEILDAHIPPVSNVPLHQLVCLICRTLPPATTASSPLC